MWTAIRPTPEEQERRNKIRPEVERIFLEDGSRLFEDIAEEFDVPPRVIKGWAHEMAVRQLLDTNKETDHAK